MKPETYAATIAAIDECIMEAVHKAIENDVNDTFYTRFYDADRIGNIKATRHNENYIEITGTIKLPQVDTETMGCGGRNWSIKIHHKPHPEYNMYAYLLVRFVMEFDLISGGKKTTGRSLLLSSQILPKCEKSDLTRILTGKFGSLTLIPAEDDTGRYTEPLGEYEPLFA